MRAALAYSVCSSSRERWQGNQAEFMQLNKGGTTTHSSLDGCVFLLFIQ
ncbi:hypothetical protein [Paenibacillus tundrae]|nr:hypothetical protein [Paenibacillus tundrae]